jgi:hypothetical protein
MGSKTPRWRPWLGSKLNVGAGLSTLVNSGFAGRMQPPKTILCGQVYRRCEEPSLPSQQRECMTVPYLARQLLVFCHPMSEFIHVSRCSRKTMVTSKGTRNYIGSRQSPTSTLRDSLSSCSSVECSEVLIMGYARKEKEVGEWRGTARMKSRESVSLEGCLGYPYIESRARLHTKR